MKLNETFANIVKHDLLTNSIPMLLGEPGIGKSSWVEALARDMNTKSFTLACNQLADKSDLTGARLIEVTKQVNGKTVPTGDYTQAFFPHIVITNAINYAVAHPDETPILFLDELNRTTSDVTSEALSIPTMRSIGNRKLPTNLKIITAGNDKGNVVSLDTASISRFVPYHVEPDIETFLNLDENINQDIKAVLIKNPNFIFQQVKYEPVDTTDDDDDDDDENTNKQLYEALNEDERLDQITTPRTITSLSKWLNSYDDQELSALATSIYTDANDGQQKSMLLDIIEAHTGKTTFSSALCTQITDRLTSAGTQGNQNNSLTLRKPTDFTKLQQAASIQDLDDMISNLSETKRESNFAYALYDKNNNTQLINELIQMLPQELSQKTVTTIIKLGAASHLNPNNVEFLCKLDHPVAKSLSILQQIN